MTYNRISLLWRTDIKFTLNLVHAIPQTCNSTDSYKESELTIFHLIHIDKQWKNLYLFYCYFNSKFYQEIVNLIPTPAIKFFGKNTTTTSTLETYFSFILYFVRSFLRKPQSNALPFEHSEKSPHFTT